GSRVTPVTCTAFACAMAGAELFARATFVNNSVCAIAICPPATAKVKQRFQGFTEFLVIFFPPQIDPIENLDGAKDPARNLWS
ncbi:MAG: hypothetical protein AAGA83_15945, partial [Cyanobacteria bacterium P01_F01_bin.116]